MAIHVLVLDKVTVHTVLTDYTVMYIKTWIVLVTLCRLDNFTDVLYVCYVYFCSTCI